MIKILLYVCFSAGGLILLKLGVSNNFELNVNNGIFNLKLNITLLGGFFLYIMSFVTSLIVMRGTNLNVFYPVSAGLIYVLVCIVSYFVLKETMSVKQLIGMCFILIGIIVMNIKK